MLIKSSPVKKDLFKVNTKDINTMSVTLVRQKGICLMGNFPDPYLGPCQTYVMGCFNKPPPPQLTLQKSSIIDV